MSDNWLHLLWAGFWLSCGWMAAKIVFGIIGNLMQRLGKHLNPIGGLLGEP